MIEKDCRNLRKQLEQVSKANKREAIVNQLNSRLDDLITLRVTVLTTTNSLKAMACRTSLDRELNPDKALDRVATIRSLLDDDPLSITKGRDFTNMKKAFEKFAEEGQVAVEATWAAYMPKARPNVNKGQITQAKQLKDSVKKADRLEKLNDRTTNLSKTPPANEEEFREIEAVWEEIRQMIDELPVISSDPKVQEFLRAANSRSGAPIDLLTDEVRIWLQENSVADKYHITTV
jgi:hypothetical protein